MSHTGNLIFTDAIKDVIGDDPVLDQFDTDYVASFYGTLQDSFITGTMLYDVSTTTKKVFLTGSRGNAFSKFNASSQPVISDVYGSPDVNRIPNLSYRLVPWKDKVSNAYRIMQCHDTKERYFDTCLPDINNAFAVDGASVWTISDDPSFLLSPYANVQSASIGYMLFNSVKADRTSQGLSNDPFVNNTWTWAYPYENRYTPEVRNVVTKELFVQSNISTTTASYSKSTTAKSVYEILMLNSLANGDFYDNSSTAPLVQPLFKDFNKLNVPKQISGFFPLLPGKSNNEMLGLTGRNSFRYFATATGSFGKVSIPTTAYGDSNLDDQFGFSTLVPSDVNLNTLISHDYLPNGIITKPSPEPLTGSMSYADTIKFLFGFGDLNNMTYGERHFINENVTKAYTENFESYTNGTKVSDLTDYTSDSDLQVRWAASIISFDPANTNPNIHEWKITKRDNTGDGILSKSGSLGKYYHYISGTTVTDPATSQPILTAGLTWLDGYFSNDFVLMSSGVYDLTSTLGDSIPFDPIPQGFANMSIASVDITSSYPWTLSYDRAVAGHTSDGLLVYFSSMPAMKNSAPDPYGPFMPVLPLEFVRGKTIAAGANALVEMKTFDLRVSASISSDEYPVYVQEATLKTSGSAYELPLPPGKWRLNFAHLKSGSTNPRVSLTSKQDIAAIDNLNIFVWKENAFPPVTGSIIGANNYPNFRTTKIDDRYNPIASGSNNLALKDVVVTGSADVYKGYVFGISPVIRGWKYGLFSGLPQNTRAVFRRNRFGQFRDMLEQRPYTKFAYIDFSPTSEEATMKGVKVKERGEASTESMPGTLQVVDSAPVEVRFVRMRYKANSRNIGSVYAEIVSPYMTTSQNLSTEVTSSLPYFDRVARHRDESTMPNLKTT